MRSASRQRTTADGGYHPQVQRDLRHTSTTGTESNSVTPSKRRTRAMDRKIQGSPEGATRCVCGETDDDGGTTMVQWYVFDLQHVPEASLIAYKGSLL